MQQNEIPAISLRVAPFVRADHFSPLRAECSITDPAFLYCLPPAISQRDIGACDVFFFFYTGVACEIYSITKTRKSNGYYLNLA